MLQLAKIYIPLQSQCPDGEMVDALVSGASAERRVGSSPILGTSKEFSFQKAPFRLPRIGLVQLVAPRQTCLRSVVVCLRKASCLLSDVAKSKFLPHRSSTPTIFNCNNLPSVRSRLLPPVESRGGVRGGGFSVFRTPKVVKAQT